MKKLFSINSDSKKTDLALLIARVGIAALMLTHGVPKLIMLFSGQPVQFPAVMGLSSNLSLTITVFVEFLCSVFLIVGLATRLSSLFSAIIMAVAAFYIHSADPFAVQEMSLHFLLVYIVLIIAGSGRYSVDYLLKQNNLKKHNITSDKNFALAG